MQSGPTKHDKGYTLFKNGNKNGNFSSEFSLHTIVHTGTTFFADVRTQVRSTHTALLKGPFVPLWGWKNGVYETGHVLIIPRTEPDGYGCILTVCISPKIRHNGERRLAARIRKAFECEGSKSPLLHNGISDS